MNEIMLNRKISRKDAYRLSDVKRGEKIPIVSDTMFNTMLNNESRKKYAAYLIALTLNEDYEKIYSSLSFVKEKLDREKEIEKGKTVDFVCKINGDIVNIEMNNNSTIKNLERNISYAMDLYKSKVKKGNPYEYQKVIQININNFSFENNNSTIEKYNFKNEEGEIFTDKITFLHIYIPNIIKKRYNKEELTELEKLILVFNETEEDSLKELCGGNEIMEEYVKDAKEASQDEEIIGLYDKEAHLEMLRLSEINDAKDQGGKEKSIEIAKKLLKNNISIEIISNSTGLSKDEIIKLKD